MRIDDDARIAVIGTGTIGASWAALFLAAGHDVAASDPAATESNDWTSSTRSIRPCSCRATMPAVTPPSAQRARMPRRVIRLPRKLVAAVEAPPDPVCTENPSSK